MTTTRDNAVHYNDGYNFYKLLPRIIGRYENSRLVLFSDVSRLLPDDLEDSFTAIQQVTITPAHR